MCTGPSFWVSLAWSEHVFPPCFRCLENGYGWWARGAAMLANLDSTSAMAVRPLKMFLLVLTVTFSILLSRPLMQRCFWTTLSKICYTLRIHHASFYLYTGLRGDWELILGLVFAFTSVSWERACLTKLVANDC